MLKRIIIVTAIMAMILGGMAFMSFVFVPKMINQALSKPPPPALVDVADAQATEIQQTISGIGTVVAIQQVTVNGEVAGKITQIFFESGATVKEGTPLVQQNDASERADLASFNSQAKLAQINLQRAQQLSGRQFVSQQTVDQAQSTLDQANSGGAKDKALIEQKLIKAPFDGVLGVRQVDLGEYLAAGGAVVTLTNLDHLYINFAVPEQNAALLKTGEAVELKADAYPGKIFTGTLTTIEPQISADTRNIKLQATFDNPDHQLLPGMFADVTVIIPAKTPAVLVPETAVTFSLYGDAVSIVRQDGKDADDKPIMKAFRTAVTAGEYRRNQVVILSGVKPGDVVIQAGQSKILDGAQVAPTRGDTLATPTTIPLN